jgi:hypothetical protein
MPADAVIQFQRSDGQERSLVVGEAILGSSHSLANMTFFPQGAEFGREFLRRINLRYSASRPRGGYPALCEFLRVRRIHLMSKAFSYPYPLENRPI